MNACCGPRASLDAGWELGHAYKIIWVKGALRGSYETNVKNEDSTVAKRNTQTKFHNKMRDLSACLGWARVGVRV